MIQPFGGLVALVTSLFCLSFPIRSARDSCERDRDHAMGGCESSLYRILSTSRAQSRHFVSILRASFNSNLSRVSSRFTETLPVELQNFRIEPLGTGFELALVGTLLITDMLASHLATQRYFRKQNNLWFEHRQQLWAWVHHIALVTSSWSKTIPNKNASSEERTLAPRNLQEVAKVEKTLLASLRESQTKLTESFLNKSPRPGLT